MGSVLCLLSLKQFLLALPTPRASPKVGMTTDDDGVPDWGINRKSQQSGFSRETRSVSENETQEV